MPPLAPPPLARPPPAPPPRAPPPRAPPPVSPCAHATLVAPRSDKLASLPPPVDGEQPLSLFDTAEGDADAQDDFLIDELFSAM